MKTALLIAGTGTLGGPAYMELVRLGWKVDVISLEDFASATPRLDFIKADVVFILFVSVCSCNKFTILL